jgi:outer membrane receptor protein involved in Fe transport
MFKVDFERWNLMAGLRLESTRADYAANELIFAGGVYTGRTVPAVGSTDYVDVLPGVHLTFMPRSNITVRAAWTNTLGRPAYADLAPISILDEVQETDGSYVGSLSTGNAGLDPYESMNLDFSFEFYMPSGMVAIAPFYKRIDNPIYDRSVTQENVVHNGRTYARFGLSRPENADRGYDPPVAEFSVGTTVRWTNHDTVAHTVTSGVSDGLAGTPDASRRSSEAPLLRNSGKRTSTR